MGLIAVRWAERVRLFDTRRPTWPPRCILNEEPTAVRRFTSNVRGWSNRELIRALKPLEALRGSDQIVLGDQDLDKQGGYRGEYFR